MSLVNTSVFFVMTPYSLLEIYRRFEGTGCLRLQGTAFSTIIHGDTTIRIHVICVLVNASLNKSTITESLLLITSQLLLMYHYSITKYSRHKLDSTRKTAS